MPPTKWAPVMTLSASVGPVCNLLNVVDERTIQWWRGPLLVQEFRIPPRERPVLAAVETGFQYAKGRYAVAITEDRLWAWGMSEDAEEQIVTALPFSPSVAFGTDCGVVVGVQGSSGIRLYLVVSAHMLVGAIMPSSLDWLRGQPVYFDHEFAVFHDTSAGSVEIYAVHLVENSSAGPFTQAPITSRVPSARRSLLAGVSDTTIEPLAFADERVARLTKMITFTVPSGADLRVWIQRFDPPPPIRGENNAIVAVHDIEHATLYCVNSDGSISTMRHVKSAVPLDGIIGYPLAALNDELRSLFWPREWSPLRLPGVVNNLNMEGNTFSIGKQYYTLVTSMGLLIEQCLRFLEVAAGCTAVARWQNAWLALRFDTYNEESSLSASDSQWNCFMTVVMAQLYELESIQRNTFLEFVLLLREDYALGSAPGNSLERLDQLLEVGGRETTGSSVYERLIDALEGTETLLEPFKITWTYEDTPLFSRLRAVLAVFSILADGGTSEELLQVFGDHDVPLKAANLAPGIRLVIDELKNYVGPQRKPFTPRSSSPWLTQDRDVTRLIFSNDRRYSEVKRLLRTDKPQHGYIERLDNITEHMWATQQKELAMDNVPRVLAAPLGRAGMDIASRAPSVLEPFTPPSQDFSVLIADSGVIIPAPAVDSANEYQHAWGAFLNGTASGLGIASPSESLLKSSNPHAVSWVSIHVKGGSAIDGGLLFGLGLMGHLCDLEEWHIFEYLGKKHDLTSVGMLLGLAASNRGLADSKIARLLSVHVTALLPMGAEAPVSLDVELAATVALGLLYHRTGHRRMSYHLLQQLKETANEESRLAAAIALGLISNRDIGPQLMLLARQPRDEPSDVRHNTGAATCLALALMYVGTGDSMALHQLELPPNIEAAQYSRPDELFSRALARVLIQWNDVGKSEQWIRNQVPTKLIAYNWPEDPYVVPANPENLWYLHSLAGTAVGVALRYAGTGDTEVETSLLALIERIGGSPQFGAGMWQQKYTPRHLMTLQCALTLGAAALMSSTGSLAVLRCARHLWEANSGGSKSVPTSTGDYEMLATAMGWLFLGGGQWAFGPRPEIAAHLSLAFVPLFGGGSAVHPLKWQHIRFLWALVAENRCMLVREKYTQKLLGGVPIQIRHKDRGSIRHRTPWLLPFPLSDIEYVRVADPDYLHAGTDGLVNYAESKRMPDPDNFEALRSTAAQPRRMEDLWNLRIIFAFASAWRNELTVITRSQIELLKALVWRAKQDSEEPVDPDVRPEFLSILI